MGDRAPAEKLVSKFEKKAHDERGLEGAAARAHLALGDKDVQGLRALIPWPRVRKTVGRTG